VINRQYAAEHRGALDARPSTQSETVMPLGEFLVRDGKSILWMLLGAMSLLLLMVCVSVASLMLARTTSRAAEFASRG